MFESLSEKLQSVFRSIRGQGRLTEANMGEALREVRRALLEADVSLPVVKTFMAKVKDAAMGQDVLKSLTPDQMLIKIVHDELVELLGGENVTIAWASAPPTVLLLLGLQGSGKTTHAAKLALHFRKKGKKPLLVAADIYRPAAIKQLEILGKQIDIPVFTLGDQVKPPEIARQALAHAKSMGHDLLIIDTAGRLHIDEVLMQELKDIQAAVPPQEKLLVVDAMIGQEAVKMAEAFHQAMDITGVILTKLDGDTRGGAALSIKTVTQRPIKFVGVGEKLDALEPFHPDRIATRILGMGDVLSLIEKAQAAIDIDEAKAFEKKLKKNDLNLEDFVMSFKQMKKIGSMEQIIGMIPGLGGMIKREDIQHGEKEIKKVEAMIGSMTPAERRKPDLLDMSRKRRVAKGSGTQVDDLNRLLKQFEEMRKMFKMFMGGGGGMPGMPGMPGMNPKKMAKMKKQMQAQMGKGGPGGPGGPFPPGGGFPPGMNFPFAP